MVVTEALIAVYVGRRLLRWYRGDVECDERGVPLADLRRDDVQSGGDEDCS